MQGYWGQLQAPHLHMTKSDAMGDKYGLTAETNTKDTQLSSRGPAAENTATLKTIWLLCKNVVYLIRGWRARLWSDLMLWTYAIAAGRDASVAREYFSKEEMIRISRDDVVPHPNMWWNVTGMRSHSWGNAVGCHQTIAELWNLLFSNSVNVSVYFDTCHKVKLRI